MRRLMSERETHHTPIDWPRPELLVALLRGSSLETAVPTTLDILAREPLASAGRFRGDLLRALMEVPNSFWARHQDHFDRYVAALRVAALIRQRMPEAERMEFWSAL